MLHPYKLQILTTKCQAIRWVTKICNNPTASTIQRLTLIKATLIRDFRIYREIKKYSLTSQVIIWEILMTNRNSITLCPIKTRQDNRDIYNLSFNRHLSLISNFNNNPIISSRIHMEIPILNKPSHTKILRILQEDLIKQKTFCKNLIFLSNSNRIKTIDPMFSLWIFLMTKITRIIHKTQIINNNYKTN